MHKVQNINPAIRAGFASLFISLLMVASMGCSSSPTRETAGPSAATPTTSKSSDATLTQPRRTNAKPIAHVLTAEPTAVVDTTVQIKGRIVQQVPLVDGRLYELQDETGSIWVVADAASEALVVGNTIQVQGTVAYENIAIAGQEQGELYIQEQQIFD